MAVEQTAKHAVQARNRRFRMAGSGRLARGEVENAEQPESPVEMQAMPTNHRSENRSMQK